MLDIIAQIKAAIHASVLAQWGVLERAATMSVDLLTGPLTGQNTRYYWVYMVQALLVVAAVYLIQRKPGDKPHLRGFLRFCFPPGTYSHPSTRVDWQVNIANFFFGHLFKVAWRLNTAFLTTGVVAGVVWAFGPAPHLLHWSAWSVVGFTLLVAVADDFGYYAFHIASHRIPFLWAFHKVHHTAEMLTPLVAGRVHPIEMALSEPTRSAAVALVAGPAAYLFAGDASFATLFGINVVALLFAGAGDQLFHSHVWLSWGPMFDRIFVSPAVHQIHHSSAPRHWHRNLGGLLSVWDWMFGTLYVPDRSETFSFGLAEGQPQIHSSLLRVYALPFWEAIPFRATVLATGLAWLHRRREAAAPVPPVATDDRLMAGD